MFSRILIGVDGRPGGREALALAQGLAEPSARLIAAHVDREARDGSPIDARPGDALVDAELAQAGVEAERLVIGDRHPGRALRHATARTGAVLRDAACPVLAVPRGTPEAVDASVAAIARTARR